MSHIHRALPMVHIPGNRTPPRPLFLSLGPPSPPLVPEPPARPRTESTLVFRAGTGDVSYSLQLHGEAPPGRVTFVHAPQRACSAATPALHSLLLLFAPAPSRVVMAPCVRRITPAYLRVTTPSAAQGKLTYNHSSLLCCAMSLSEWRAVVAPTENKLDRHELAYITRAPLRRPPYLAIAAQSQTPRGCGIPSVRSN